MSSRMGAPQLPEQKQLNRRLMIAIKSHETATAIALLSRGADPNTKDPSITHSTQSAFLLAVQGLPGTGPAPENLPLVKALIAKGANVNACDEHNTTALMSAVIYGHLATVRLLLDRGAKVNLKDNGFHMKVLERGREFTTYYGGRTALQYAQEFKEWNDVATMRLLLQRGAEVNVRDQYGMTLLMAAASGDDVATMRLLLEYGADVNARAKDGTTALMLAANSAQGDAITLLHQHRAEVNARDANGETALIYSMEGPGDNPKTVQMLLNMGADCCIKSLAGKTALSIALKEDYTESVRLLKQAGAKQ